MTIDITLRDRAMKNQRLMDMANRGNYRTLSDVEDNRLCLIAAATMMVLEKGWEIDGEGIGTPEQMFSVFHYEYDAMESPDLLTALLDALEADND